jgi:Ca2+-binding RTX toxin-like protein
MFNNQSLQTVQNQLAHFAAQSNFNAIMSTAFGSRLDRGKLQVLRQQWLSGNFSIIPDIQILSQGELGTANGAYAASLDRIFVSSDFLAHASESQVTALILEEVGHRIDQLLNGGVDSAGDEGEIFSRLVSGESLATATLAGLKSQNDHGVITVNGLQVAVENQNYFGENGAVGDTIFGSEYDDNIFGGGATPGFDIGNDILNGLGGNDYITGQGGDDVVIGGFGNDDVYGGPGNDTLYGGLDFASPSNAGYDSLSGNLGNDTYQLLFADSLVQAGANISETYGTDTISIISSRSVNIDLSLTSTQDILPGVMNYFGLTLTPFLAEGIENLSGGSGNDTLKGNSFDNYLWGGNGNDTIYGRTGNDTIYGEIGDDIIYGEVGDDKLWAGNGNDTLYGGTGNDFLIGGSGAYLFNGGDGNDYLSGGSDRDIINGDAGNDTLAGYTGGDILNGGKGNDNLNGGAGSDIYIIDADIDTGYDIINDIAGINILDFRSSATIVSVDLSKTSVRQIVAAGVDIQIQQAASIAYIYGGSNSDELHGSTLSNYLLGGFGSDFLTGDLGDDTLIGGAGNDRLFDDTVVKNGGGNDLLDGGAGNDILDGGAGNDTLYGGTGNDQLSEGAVVFSIVSDGNDLFDGGAGNDNLQSGYGNDTLIGGAGNDNLSGWTGNNTFNGGTGSDYFRFVFRVGFSTPAFVGTYTTSNTLGRDTISDFAVGVDKIVLDNRNFTKINSVIGPNGEGSIGSNFVTVANDSLAGRQTAAIVYSIGSGNLFYNVDGATNGAANNGLGANGGNFAFLSSKPVLTASSIVIRLG